MKGYDKEQARAFILARIDRRLHCDLSDRLEELVTRAIDADIAYMHACGALDESGDTGEGYYDEDDAFEYIWTRSWARRTPTTRTPCASPRCSPILWTRSRRTWKAPGWWRLIRSGAGQKAGANHRVGLFVLPCQMISSSSRVRQRGKGAVGNV